MQRPTNPLGPPVAAPVQTSKPSTGLTGQPALVFLLLSQHQAVRGLRRNLSLLVVVASTRRKVSSTLLHWSPVLVGLQDQDEKLLETNWQLGTRLMISWNFFSFLSGKAKMCISVKVLVQTGMQQVPWEEQRQTLSGSLFPVSCSAADVKEDFHWNTGHSCKFWLCPKYSGPDLPHI